MTAGYTMWAFFIDEKITDEPALERSTYIWISTIPILGLSWLFLYLFYKFGHVWKSEGVVVGFEYDNDLVDESNKLWQTNMLGHWVVLHDSIVNETKTAERVEDTREVKLNLHV